MQRPSLLFFLPSRIVDQICAANYDQGTENPRVGGSIPPLATILHHLFD
jgi:hypothetical protein